jgi:N-acetylmuramoyl-L-alanine amidase
MKMTKKFRILNFVNPRHRRNPLFAWFAPKLKRAKAEMPTRLQTLLCSLSLSLLLFGCAGMKLKLHDWTDLPKTQYSIPPFARYLAPYKIALDPGHGGLSHLPNYKRGPTGKEEAVMNLNVAFFLKEFLEKVGVKVVMTRTDDRFVSLNERNEIAAAAGCDFMISLHHNASDNPQTNYAAVFYHLRPDYSPMSMDLGRHIYFGLVEALRLPQVANDGLLTDKLIYPDGFGLLRTSPIPAVLLESSFFSNPAEEKRLTKLSYNRREAYGIFLGLARWAAGGIPSARLMQPAGISRDKQPEIVYEIFDGITERGGRGARQLLVYSPSVSLKIDGQTVPAQMDMRSRRLRFRPDSALSNGPHLLQADLQNLFKNHNLPRVDTIIVAAPTMAIHFETPTNRLPADGVAMMPIRLKLADADSQPVWDDTKVSLQADRGRIAPATPQLKNSSAVAYYQAAAEMWPVHLIATADGHSDTLALELAPAGEFRVLSGVVVDDSTKVGLNAAAITIDDSLNATTDENGGFFMANLSPGPHRLTATARGYASENKTIMIDSSRSAVVPIRLKANLSGILHNEAIILDAALGGSETGEAFHNGYDAASANFELVQRLADTLRWAGANVVMVREDQNDMSVAERIEKVNKMPEGWYLKLVYRRWDADSVLAQSTIYPANRVGEQIAAAINTAFSRLPRSRAVLLQNTAVPEVNLTNKTALEVMIKCRTPLLAARDLPALLAGIVSYKTAERANGEREEN